MAVYTESDVTYCSDAEKENQQPIRRSKRLSQKNYHSNFRFNLDPIQRLSEIHQILKYGDLNSKLSIDDWETLNIEVKLIQKELKGKQKGKINFILNKINKNLKNKSSTCANESSDRISIESNPNNEQVKSPNILAGMMSEVLTEIPPYQPKSLPQFNNLKINSQPRIGLTQKNPHDLTRSSVLKNNVPQVSVNNSQQQQKQPERPTNSKRATTSKQSESNTMSISKDPMIDLTEELHFGRNHGMTSSTVKEPTFRPKYPTHISKWLQFVPTQQRPTFPGRPSFNERLTFNERPTKVITPPAVVPKKPTKLSKNNNPKLSREDFLVNRTISNIIQKNLTHGFATQAKYFQKQNSPPIRPQCDPGPTKKPFRNTESMLQQNRTIHRVAPPTVQKENPRPISPDFLINEFMDLNTDDLNDSGASLTLSLKEDFKKIFGTDKLEDVFGKDEVIYNLKENHVRSLARALKVEHGALKKTIENILANEYNVAFEEESMHSDSSVVECSQSPPHRIFPSQRSQSQSQSKP